MIVGDEQRFAIEAELDEVVDGWVLGHLRFWIGGHSIGDWEDTVDLAGCLHWIRDFCECRRERFEPGLFDLNPDEVFEMLYDGASKAGKKGGVPTVADAFSRFSIAHLGMSSLDRFDWLLLTDEMGTERCLWRSGQGQVMSFTLNPGEMERQAHEFCRRATELSPQLGA